MNYVPVQEVCRMAALVCLMAGCSMTRLLAQTSGTGTSTMSVVLSDVLQLTVNTNTISLNFATATNYNSGVTSLVNSQITIMSNKAYEIRMKASSANMVNGANTIPVNNVKVRPVGLGVGTSQTIAALSTTDQALATVMPATMSQSVNIEYSTPAGDTDFLKPAGPYSVTLTFTLIAN